MRSGEPICVTYVRYGVSGWRTTSIHCFLPTKACVNISAIYNTKPELHNTEVQLDIHISIVTNQMEQRQLCMVHE